VPEEKVSVIHYGIDPERFSGAQTNLKQKWALEDKLVIGTIGRLEPRKGHDCLIRAISDLKNAVPNVFLAIAGHDPANYGRDLESLINNFDLKQEVRLVGFQSDVPAFLSALDIFAFATHSEGFGQVVVEAMAAGKPLVASNIPPLTEIVLDGETGMLVAPENPAAFADAISWLLTHREQARAMGMRGQGRVRTHFSAERMSAQTYSLYEQLIRG
jgi:glycosyltransferase involved in cell wall biosynthesis